MTTSNLVFILVYLAPVTFIRLQVSMFCLVSVHSVMVKLHCIKITRPCKCDRPLTPRVYIENWGLQSYFCSKTKIVGTRKNRLIEAVLTCSNNPCFEQK